MARKLKEYIPTFVKGPKKIWDWDLLFNGEIWALEQGVDFQSPSLHNTADYIRKAARSLGIDNISVFREVIDGKMHLIIYPRSPEENYGMVAKSTMDQEKVAKVKRRNEKRKRMASYLKSTAPGKRSGRNSRTKR